MHRFVYLPFIAVVLMTSSCSTKHSCDLVLFNGVIHTMDDDGSTAEAIAVRDGRVVAIGSNEAVLAEWSAGDVIDLAQRQVYPGFIDAHAHLFGLGEEAVILRLHETASKDEVLALLKERAAGESPDTWIRGRGWDQNDWPVKAFPDLSDLDAITTRHPVFLSRIDGHAVWVNSRALDLAGITRDTPDPEGGRIVRDTRGEATGILLDAAIELVRSHIPPPDINTMTEAYANAIKRCLSVGLTGMHDMGMTHTGIEAMRGMIARKAFPFHVVAYVDDSRKETWESLLREGRQVFGDEQLTIAGLKLYADGALGSRGAWLLEDYSDDPGNRGISIQTGETISRETARALEAGLQVCVHAIGDAAVRSVLDAYEKALYTRKPGKTAGGSGEDHSVEYGDSPYPLRIEHAQVITIEDIPRFAALGVIPSMQPTHCTSDMTWAEARLGARRVQTAYPWAALIQTGTWIPGGSDFPVERPEPLAGIHAAMFRMNSAGQPASQADIDGSFQTDATVPSLEARWKNGWFAEQCMSRGDALRAFTIWAARAAGMERTRGSLEQGKWADFVILSENLLTVPRERFLSTRVLSTWIAGRKVYSAEE